MENFVCVHAHFYQPPRENPWLEEVEYQESAYPYHDWNERVAVECYAPNATSRLLDAEGRIEAIVNNYSRISFNFGPTLLAWLEQKKPAIYAAIREAELESRSRFSGHGSALAQPYSHAILPLANRRDKETQVLWGVRDFVRRFGREPEGMWLPETAVDLETLDVLAGVGIRFTVLAPRQASQVRKLGENEWRDVGGERIDPALPYRVELPSGRSMALFFYDGAIAKAVAFEGLLGDGRKLAERILQGFSTSRPPGPQLVHIATDGESYGHHHKHGEMALTYALHHLESNNLARLTNYAEFLERFPPTQEVRVIENTSWSCMHGIERWRGDCGCNSGGHPDWNQKWRAPLRQAMDGLRDELAPAFEAQARELFQDPWAARNDFIDLLRERTPEQVDNFLESHRRQPLGAEETVRALQLLELQRHAQLMYTSCGWFFDEISGIEAVQVLQYAGRAIQLGQALFGETGAEARFLEKLEGARSNIAEQENGRRCYERYVKTAMVDLPKVGAHYAISSLFAGYGEQDRIFCYRVERGDLHSFTAGKTRLILGRATITSEITRESATVHYGVLHLGDHNVTGGIRESLKTEEYEALVAELSGIFQRGELPEIIRATDRSFGKGGYSLKFLFRDEQRRILGLLTEETLADAEDTYRELYQEHAALMHFLPEFGYPLPRPLALAAELALNGDLRRALQNDELEPEALRNTIAEAAAARIPLVQDGQGLAFRDAIRRLAERVQQNPGELALLQKLDAAVELSRAMPFEVLIFEAQNIYYRMAQEVYPDYLRRAGSGDAAAGDWIRAFVPLGEKLSVRLPPPA